MSVDPSKRHKLGRRATLCEAYLGITPGAFSDNIRFMVAGFVPGGEAIKNKNIKIGDWLRSVDGREVNVQNLENLLSGILEPTDVRSESSSEYINLFSRIRNFLKSIRIYR